MRHVLVTNDFPPKVGGIQSYLWELWRRLPAAEVTVLTTNHDGSDAWDRDQQYRVERVKQKVLLPVPGLANRIDALADETDSPLVLLDPALPLGLVGSRLRHPYGVVLHGAEITVPGRVPGVHLVLRHVLRGACINVAAGGYPLAEAERAAGRDLPCVLVPPGVDTDRFRPLDADQRVEHRIRHGLDPDRPLIVSLSRLVPRKGMDVLIKASAQLRSEIPDLQVAIGGTGRDRDRLDRLVTELDAPVRLLGRVDDDDLPGLYGCADVFAMLCRNRWAGLEQEGFGIVFLEAAAAGVPQIAGASGGAHEAVVDSETGFVVDDPTSVDAVVDRLRAVLLDPELRIRFRQAARERACQQFSYDVLAARLHEGLDGASGLGS